MKTAVVYYSMSGNTKLIADRLSERMGCDLIPISPKKAYPDKGFRKFLWGGKSVVMGDLPELLPYEFDADKYDLVIFGSPVWASSFAPPLRTFVNEHREELKEKEIALFVCCLGGGGMKAVEKFSRYADHELCAEAVFTEPKSASPADIDEAFDAFVEAFRNLDDQRHKCPICGKYVFEAYNCMDMCDICGWSDDALQVKDPDMRGGANEMSFNEAKAAYAEGKRIY